MVPTFITGTTEDHARLPANAHPLFLRYGIMLRVYCLDAGAHDALEELRVPSVPLLAAPADPAQCIYGTAEFREVSMRKLTAISDALLTNTVVVWVDGDVVPVRDPCAIIADIAERMHADDVEIAAQCDEPEPRACRGPGACWMCSGIMVIRRTPNVVTMVREPPPALSFPQGWDSDQDYINWFARLARMRCAILPRSLFPNGVYKDAIPAEAVMMHYNYMKGNEKEQAMRHAGFWVLEA